MKNKYRNPWHKDLNLPKPEFYQNDAPKFFEHRGVQVFKLAPKSFDYVLKGVCITQRAGARDPQELIDAILDRRQPISDQVKAIFPELLSWDEVPETNTKNQKGKNAKP